MKSNQPRNGEIAAVFFNGGMTFALCGLSYWLITHLLARVFSVSRDDDLLGGMWAVVATVFVFRNGCEQSVRAALTYGDNFVEFCALLHLTSAIPVSLLGNGRTGRNRGGVMSLLGRPDDIITTGITTTVVMVVAAMSPNHAWHQPILRMLDTIVGVVVGLVGAWISLMAMNGVRRTSSAVEIARKTLKEQVCNIL